MAKIVLLCALLGVHALVARALKLPIPGGGSLPSIPIIGDLGGDVPSIPTGGQGGGLASGVPTAPGQYVPADASPPAQGLLGVISSDPAQDILGLGDGPLDQILNPLLDPLLPDLSGILDDTVGELLSNLSPDIELANVQLVAALENEDPLGVRDQLNAAVSSLTGVVGQLLTVVVPTNISYGPAPDEVARSFGLRGDRYTVTTEDGFILTLFRIRGPASCLVDRRVAVLVSSGFNNAANFVLLREESLALKLAWDCYDVWIISLRGSRWGRGHVSLSDVDPQFWNNTIKEMGIYDLPTSLRHISECTGSTELIVIAEDIGASSYIVMNSELGDDSPQCLVRRAYMIEPLFYLTHTKSTVFSAIAVLRDVLGLSGNLVLHNELILGGVPVHSVLYLLSRVTPTTLKLVLEVLFGKCTAITEVSVLKAFLYMLDSAQILLIRNFVQMIGNEQSLMQVDYGTQLNLQAYGTPEPPLYNFAATNTPCTLIFNENSTIVTTLDWSRSFALLNENAAQRSFVVPGGNAVSSYLAEDPDPFFYDQLMAFLEEDNCADNIPDCTNPCRPITTCS